MIGGGAKAAEKPWTIVPFATSPFPYDGTVPDSGKPFLDTVQNGRRAHTSPRGGVYSEATYEDQSVLLAATPHFGARQSVLVVFLHGNLVRLERDVVRRQRVVAQVTASGLNAALVVPQFAVDALDSSAGHFWDADGFARFLDEAAEKLASFNGVSPDAVRAMPVVLAAYSGGYNPAAAILSSRARIAGVILLDALYADEDVFADWIVRSNRESFFFSAYSTSSAPGNQSLEAKIVGRGVSVTQGLPRSLTSGVTAFLSAGAVPHNDFVTRAWAVDPLRLSLSRVRI